MNPTPLDSGAKSSLRVAHCVGFYFPDTVGGTEVYVDDLASVLSRFDVGSSIIAATNRDYEEYEWAGTPVVRYPSNWADLREYSSAAGKSGLSKFQEVVARSSPDVFHLHSWTSGAGLRHLAQVAQLGIPCVVTVHVPSALCMRGTMILDGERPCDGLILEKRCAKCWAMYRGLPAPVAHALSSLPRMTMTDSWIARLSRRAGTVLSGRALVRAQAEDLHAMEVLSDHIVAPSLWVSEALVLNGVPREKIMVSRQAVAQSLVDAGLVQRRAAPVEGELRIGFIGRLEHYKGPHILLEAMAAIPRDVPVRLVVAGSGTEPPYLRTLEQLVKGETRVDFLGPLSHDQIGDFLRQIDILAVPSNYMETGPLVVLEAFAFGLPVMGANLGGIAERIRDGVDGWLLQFDDSSAWAAAIREAATDRAQVKRRLANVRVAHTMTDVASEMAGLYRRIVEARRAGGRPAGGPGR